MDRDLSRSRAILISNATYRDPGIPDLPAASGCTSAMARLLTGDLCGWPADRVESLMDVSAPHELARKIVDMVKGVQDVLLLYYVGHGMRTPTGQLALALRESSADPELLPHTAILYEAIARILRGCPAVTKLVILDCCHAELGNKANYQFQSAEIDGEPVDGLYFIGASKQYEKARSPLSGGLTYFTNAFIDVVNTGIPGKPPQLTIDQIFTEQRTRMLRANLPEPVQSGIRDAHHWPFARNAARPETHRDLDKEIASLLEWKSAAEARERALRADVAERMREMERLREQAQASESRSADHRQKLSAELREADTRLGDATTAQAEAHAEYRQAAESVNLALAIGQAQVGVTQTLPGASPDVSVPSSSAESGITPESDSPAPAATSILTEKNQSEPGAVVTHNTTAVPPPVPASPTAERPGPTSPARPQAFGARPVIRPVRDTADETEALRTQEVEQPREQARRSQPTVADQQRRLDDAIPAAEREREPDRNTAPQAAATAEVSNIAPTAGHHQSGPPATASRRSRLLGNEIAGGPLRARGVFVTVGAGVALIALISVILLALSEGHGKSQIHSSAPPSRLATRPEATPSSSPPLSPEFTLRGTNGQQLYGAEFSPVADILANDDDTGQHIYLWNAATGKLAASLYNPNSDGIQDEAFSPGGGTLAAADFNGKIYLWNVATHKITTALTVPTRGFGVSGVLFSPDGASLVATDGFSNIYLLNVATGRITATLNLPDSEDVWNMTFSPGGTLAISGAGGSIYLADVATGRITATLNDPASEGISQVAFSPGGSTLAADDDNGSIYLWDVATRKVVTTLNNPSSKGFHTSRGLAFSHGGSVIAACYPSGNIYLWDVATRKVISILHDPDSKGAPGVAFSPDGTMLAAADSNGNTYLWNMSWLDSKQSDR
jgi:DNA-binding beta-propeller fold protein YncE